MRSLGEWLLVCQCECGNGEDLLVHRYVEAEGLDKTFRYRQQEIAAAVPLANQQHYFDLKLSQLGPYSITYSRNGR